MKNRKVIFTTFGFTLCFALAPVAEAVVPAPDGGYPGGNTAEGQSALLSLTSGAYNTAAGFFSLKANIEGSFNTAIGAGALLSNSTGQSNTAIGAVALANNTTANDNTAIGDSALFQNTTGDTVSGSGTEEHGPNTAIGAAALFQNTTGSSNTALGAGALASNTDANFNTAVGFKALARSTAPFNAALGFKALVNDTTGAQNAALGTFALYGNHVGTANTAIGQSALFQCNADNNVAVGAFAAAANIRGFENTAIGYQALINNTGAGNTALGYLAGSNLTAGDDNICIGADGVAGEGGVIRIGRSFINSTYIAGISGQTASGGAQVFVASDGKLGTNNSSARFKDEIKPMGTTSEVILALRPVCFRYKREIDPQRIPQFGLVAEEVEKVNPDLIIRDQKGKPQSVRYEQINSMLLNEFLKEHEKVEAQQATITQLESKGVKQEATIRELQKGMGLFTAELRQQAAQIQKVSAQIQMTVSAADIALSNP